LFSFLGRVTKIIFGGREANQACFHRILSI